MEVRMYVDYVDEDNMDNDLSTRKDRDCLWFG